MRKRDEYTTIMVTKELKRRVALIAAANNRSVPRQIKEWCDQAEAGQATADCPDETKNSTDLK